MRKIKSMRLLFVPVWILFSVLFLDMEEAKAASSYDNAREFYESTGQNGYHAELYQGDIYFATCGKLAASTSGTKYREIGYDMELSGKGQTVGFSVKRGDGGSMVNISIVDYKGYRYNLYKMSCQQIIELAGRRNANAASIVFDSDAISVRIDSIMTIVKNGVETGGVTEDGSGNILKWGTVYHLKSVEDWKTMKGIFSGHTFESFRNICQDMENYRLSIRYVLNGGTVANGYGVEGDILHLNGSPVTTSARLMQPVTLLDCKSMQLLKTGYHMEEGKEWAKETDGRVAFSSGGTYGAKVIEPEVGRQNINLYLYANWRPNTYLVQYDANGGKGIMSHSTMVYDQKARLNGNGYSKIGYSFKGWNTKKDGTGVAYEEGQEVKNLTEVQNGVVVLYAQWKPEIYSITMSKEGGMNGTDSFYEMYGNGWFADKTGTKEITGIMNPVRKGYEMEGYYSNIYGMGDAIVDGTGQILVDPTYFIRDSLIYAKWKEKSYTITFEKQGGIGGTDSVTAIYNKELPVADGPMRTGYTFQGYYTKKDGKGLLYYNENMAGVRKYLVDDDITLYAYWTDETEPQVYLSANISNWTNRKIMLSAVAYDYGVGLSSLTLYRDGEKVAEQGGLMGARKLVLELDNVKEGVINYKAVATDMNGLTAEVFKSVYYDILPPKGTILAEKVDSSGIEIEVDVNDFHVD